MVVDTSAVLAIFREEAEAARFAQLIAADEQPSISAATVLEASIVLRGLKKGSGTTVERWLDDFIAAAGLAIEPVTPDQARLARIAHMRFGKGTGHKAALNYGDCFVYALARALDAPLLCKGDDFPLTDLKLV